MKQIFFLIVMLAGMVLAGCTAPELSLKAGDAAPNFTLQSDDGRAVSLSDYKGKQPVVLYFYPQDETPGCTTEACAFRDAFAEFKAAGAEVLGVSVDDAASHQKFRQKEKLNFTLLSDTDKKVSKAYGVLTGMGYADRITFIIDKDGRIKKIYPKVDPSSHIAEVLAAVKSN
ncbi:MAG: thioredoxin-dependent thiol peroxidase [Rhizobacter sp.]|nr:thioredoxin-dependent thiol peroxidase [Chlorobiales bacterium]